MTRGEKLKRLRTEKGLTQKKVITLYIYELKYAIYIYNHNDFVYSVNIF